VLSIVAAILVPAAAGFALGWLRGALLACGLWTATLAVIAINDTNPGGDFYAFGVALGYPYFTLIAGVGAAAKNGLSGK
jgi:hypothetical protein